MWPSLLMPPVCLLYSLSVYIIKWCFSVMLLMVEWQEAYLCFHLLLLKYHRKNIILSFCPLRETKWIRSFETKDLRVTWLSLRWFITSCIHNTDTLLPFKSVWTSEQTVAHLNTQQINNISIHFELCLCPPGECKPNILCGCWSPPVQRKLSGP